MQQTADRTDGRTIVPSVHGHWHLCKWMKRIFRSNYIFRHVMPLLLSILKAVIIEIIADGISMAMCEWQLGENVCSYVYTQSVGQSGSVSIHPRPPFIYLSNWEYLIFVIIRWEAVDFISQWCCSPTFWMREYNVILFIILLSLIFICVSVCDC